MKLKYALAFSAMLFSVFLVNEIFAQSTFEQVHAIFQAKCTAGCHSSGSPSGNLNLSGTTADVYNRLVNVNPTNPVAAANGLKRVDPGYTHRSFLMKKVNNGLDVHNDLETGEGNTMPDGQPSLTLTERELIRQWIIWGAPDTGNVHNEQLIAAYYNGQGIPEIEAPLTPEEEGREGYQVRFGPIFVEPGGEFELFQVYKTKTTEDREIIEMKSKISPYSHHWVMRTIEPGAANNLGVAPVDGNDFTTQAFVFQYAKYMGVWQFSGSIDLPEGTAIFQDSAAVILLNLHIPNYNQDSILAATGYINFYTQPAGSGAVEMKTDLATYGAPNPFVLNIPPTGQPHTLDFPFTIPGETRYFWSIQGHTHQWGIDYDMFLRNNDGSKGDLIYEGFYNSNYSFNQGYWDYTHPAIRIFEPMLEVDMNDGMIFEASWLNNGPDTVPFSFTTQGEMFITYYQYTTELPTSVKDGNEQVSSVDVYPNPSRDNINLSYTLKNTAHAVVELFNHTGSKVKTIVNAVQSAGKHLLKIKSADEELAPGTYMVSVTVDGEVTTKKIVSLN